MDAIFDSVTAASVAGGNNGKEDEEDDDLDFEAEMARLAQLAKGC